VQSDSILKMLYIIRTERQRILISLSMKRQLLTVKQQLLKIQITVRLTAASDWLFFSLQRYQEAVEAYKKALSLDPTNQALKESLTQSEAQLQQINTRAESSSEGASTAAPNFADLLNNPAILNMARNLGATGAGPEGGFSADGAPPNLQSLLSDPNLLNMAQQVMSQPGFSQLVNDPSIRNMAQGLMSNPSGLQNLFQGLQSGNNPGQPPAGGAADNPK